MKKYSPGMIAVILAVTAFAFTDVPSFKSTESSKKALIDPCPESQKKWFLMQLPCDLQLEVADVRNPNNYMEATIEEVLYDCNGSECVCAIWACPVLGVSDVPNISSNTSIYEDLYRFFKYGATSINIELKDLIYEEQRRR